MNDASIQELVSYVTIVLELIYQQEWAKLEKVIAQQQLFRLISEHIQKCDEFNGMTLLHAALKNKPPLHILEAMIMAHCDALSGQDCLGRTPLHVACGSGADARIIRRLVSSFPYACDLPDEDGRLPLHIACDTECVLFEGDETPRAPPSHDAVRALLSGSLRSTLVEDEDEMNPIEYAIVSDLDIKTVRLLQKASMVVRRQDAQESNNDPTTNSTSTVKVAKPIAPLPRNILGYC